ncbi:MAG: hypothetical protein JO023_00300 [Chloroflexi bacterium]|nr:hypothetical protein [Chloroflexota bacterium]
MEDPAFEVPLNGYTMLLRRVELDPVATGVEALAGRRIANTAELARALRQVPVADRAPTWELTVRHFGRRTPLTLAAAQIGLDELRAPVLIDAYLARLPG